MSRLACAVCFTSVPSCNCNSKAAVVSSGTRIKGSRFRGLHSARSYQERQTELLDNLFSDRSECSEDSLDKGSPGQSDLVHGLRRNPLGLNNQYQPGWVDSQLGTLSTRLHNSHGGEEAVSSTGGDEFQKLCDEGQLDKAVSSLLQLVDQRDTSSLVSMYRSVLNACAKQQDLALAKRVYAHLEEQGLESITMVGEDIVGTFVKCGGLEDAVQVFDRLPYKSVLSWTALISGYATAGRGREALSMYGLMKENGVVPDTYTFVSLLKACTIIADLEEGKRIHDEAVKYRCDTDLFVGNCLVDMYGKCGSILDAYNVFCSLPKRDVVTWNAMLAAFAQHNQAEKVLQLYTQMREEGVSTNNRTFVSTLQACAMLGERESTLEGEFSEAKFLQKGKSIHADAWRQGHESDVFVGSTLVSMYGKCGSIEDAWTVFDALPERNLVSWNTMLTAYVEWGQSEKVLELYEAMQEEGVIPDTRTLVSVLQACGMEAEKEEDVFVEERPIKVKSLGRGKVIHTDAWRRSYQSHAFVGSTLISMYVKCGSIEDASDVFNGLSDSDVVTWNAMLAAYAQPSQSEKSLQLYEDMLEKGVDPNVWTYVNTLQACAALAEEVEDVLVDGRWTKVESLVKGKVIHSATCRQGYNSDGFVGSTLVCMYAKSGSIADAWNVFSGLSDRNVVLWTAIITAFVDQGQAEKALELYEQMWEEGVTPNDRTFVSALKACNLLAEVEEYVPVLGQSIKVKGLAKGRTVHTDARKTGYDTCAVVGNALINMYQKCGSMADACYVFDGMSQHDVSSWTMMLSGYVENGQAENVLQLYDQMLQEGINGGVWVFVSLLQACGMLAEKADRVGVDAIYSKQECLEMGWAIHSDTRKDGYDTNLFVGSTLVGMYGKCGSIADASYVFDALCQRDVITWNAMLLVYAQHGEAEKVLQLYETMWEEGVQPDARIYVTILQACSMLAEKESGVVDGRFIKPESLKRVRAIHNDAWRNGYESDVFLGNTLVSTYTKCGGVEEARNLFDSLSERNLLSWNAMLTVHVEHEQPDTALQIYEDMLVDGVSPDAWTFVRALQACSMLADKEDVVDGHSVKLKSFLRGKAIHAHAWMEGYESHVFVGNTLVSMYGKCGSIIDAWNVFDGLSERKVVSWNAMLGAYVDNLQGDEALQLYERMQEEGGVPDAWTFSVLLQACGLLVDKEDVPVHDRSTMLKPLEITKRVHAEAWKNGYASDVFVGSTLVSTYGKCRSIADARSVFDGLPQHDEVAWNAMLAAYVEQEDADKALYLYEEMRETGVTPDAWSYVAVLQACGMLAEREPDGKVNGQVAKVKSKSFQKGKAIHADARRKGYKSDIFIGNTLISMYGKCGSVMDAQTVFDGLSERDVVSWTAIMGAYLEAGQADKALQLYRQMQLEGSKPKESTLVCILQLCGKTGGMVILREIHQFLMSANSDFSPLLASTLISAFGRCGNMVDARRVFIALPQPDVVAWNSLMAGYARKGDSGACLQCYKDMQLAGVKPDGMTFLSLLCACSHAGQVDNGVKYFESMSRDYGVIPEVEHYVSMVDLLGRAGYFSKVEDLLSRMPMQPSLELWFCLLGACQKHGKLMLAEKAFKFAVNLQPTHSAPYVLMSNIYADAGLLDHAKEVQKLRQKVGAWKKPGKSWIEHQGTVHTFMAGDRNHPQKERIYKFLKQDCFKLKSILKNQKISQQSSN